MTEQKPDDAGGIQFPQVGGRRSTTQTAQQVFAAAVRDVDARAAAAIEGETAWRKRYPRHLRAVLEAEAVAADAAVRIARTGIDRLRAELVFADAEGERPLATGLPSRRGAALGTTSVKGEGVRQRELVVPYRGRQLRGDELHRQLDDWVARDIAEPSFAEVIRRVMANPDWLAVPDRQVVLLGAGAEMGPLQPLTAWGASVLAVDVARPAVWQRIAATARAGSGVVHAPVHGDADLEQAGADLLTETPEILDWIGGVDGSIVVGNYAYADGSSFVRVAMAADSITAELLAQRGDVAVAYLATPTDVFVVPAEAAAAAQDRFAHQGWRGALYRPLRLMTGGRLFAPHYAGTMTTQAGPVGIADALVTQQGPNYALAKRLQRWRAVLARHEGVLTSAHVAPSTRTRSVMKNRILAAAYRGAPLFGVEIFDPATSNTLMAAVLVHDLHEPSAAANPVTPLAHPHQLFMEAANHGGLWREQFHPRTALPVAAVLGLAGLGPRS